MEVIFLKVCNMSMMAGIAAIIVLILRALLQRAPKRVTCLLWFLVFLRFLCPVNLTAGIGLIPEIDITGGHLNSQLEDSKLVKEGTAEKAAPESNRLEARTASKNEVSDVVKKTSENEMASKEVSQKKGERQENNTAYRVQDKVLHGAAMVWLTGVIVLIMVLLLQSAILHKKLRTATLISHRNKRLCAVYESDKIHTPFLYGIFRPVIYLPLGTEDKKEFILKHEQMHKKHLDHILKPICFIAVIIHWFNPIAWISFSLFTRDVEMSCDEAVLRDNASDIRKEYSFELLQMSDVTKHIIFPPAFGESNISRRIRHILKYKKPSVWIQAVAVIVILVASVILLTNTAPEEVQEENTFDEKAENVEFLDMEESFESQLCRFRNPYIGDNSANSKLVGLLPIPKGYEWDSMELNTSEKPYELIMRWKKSKDQEMSLDISDVLFSNAAYLFAAIENMEICTMELPVLNGEGTYYASYSRSDLEAVFGSLYERTESVQNLHELTEEIELYLKGDFIEPKIHADNFMEPGSESFTLEAGDDPKADLLEFINLAVLGKTEKYHIMTGTENVVHSDAEVIFDGEQQLFRELIQSDTEITVYVSALTVFYEEDTTNVFYHVQFPAAITVFIDTDGSYHLREFWTPRKGTEFEASIKEKFPEKYWEDALDTGKYTDIQKQKLWPLLTDGELLKIII